MNKKKRKNGTRDRNQIILFFCFKGDREWGSGHFHRRIAGLTMIHCVQLWFESANGQEGSEADVCLFHCVCVCVWREGGQVVLAGVSVQI